MGHHYRPGLSLHPINWLLQFTTSLSNTYSDFPASSCYWVFTGSPASLPYAHSLPRYCLPFHLCYIFSNGRHCFIQLAHPNKRTHWVTSQSFTHPPIPSLLFTPPYPQHSLLSSFLFNHLPFNSLEVSCHTNAFLWHVLINKFIHLPRFAETVVVFHENFQKRENFQNTILLLPTIGCQSDVKPGAHVGFLVLCGRTAW